MRRRTGFILLAVGIIFAIGAGFMVTNAMRAATTRARLWCRLWWLPKTSPREWQYWCRMC